MMSKFEHQQIANFFKKNTFFYLPTWSVYNKHNFQILHIQFWYLFRAIRTYYISNSNFDKSLCLFLALRVVRLFVVDAFLTFI